MATEAQISAICETCLAIVLTTADLRLIKSPRGAPVRRLVRRSFSEVGSCSEAG
jgi:hypothetical protein